MMTAKDIEEVHRAAEMWRLNNERNKRIEKEKLSLIERTRPVITEKDRIQARKVAKRIVKEKYRKFWAL